MTIKWTTWAWEYSAVLASIGSFAAMVVVLAHFDGKAVFEWKGMTPNTIVSLLSLAVKASLGHAIAECMAQWKWILFARESRPLMDFDRIDAATRGPLGSLRVITRTRGSLALQLGAVLTLLIIGLDPLAQQLIQLRSDLVIDSEPLTPALIAMTSSYTQGLAQTVETGPCVGNGCPANSTEASFTVTPELPLSMKSAVLTGLSRAPRELEQEVLVQCPTSNCTWGPFFTLGVCHRCNDITARLTPIDAPNSRLVDILDATLGFSGMVSANGSRVPGLLVNSNSGGLTTIVIPHKVRTTAYSLPNGHFIANGNGCSLDDGFASCTMKLDDGSGNSASVNKYTTTSFGTGNPNKTVTMQDIDTLIWSMSVISPNANAVNTDSSLKWPDVPLQATECAIYYCVKNVTSVMKGNHLVEDITEAESSRDPDSWQRAKHRDMPEKYNPPPDEVDSLEFNPRYSVASYTPLELDSPGSKSPFQVGQGSVKAISDYFQSLFLANYSIGDIPGVTHELDRLLHQSAVGVNGGSFGPPGETLDATPPALKNLWTWNRHNMTRTFYALATSMTNDMRRSPKARSGGASGASSASPSSGQDDDTDGTMALHGRVLAWTTVYEIQWGWIALHGLVLLLGVLFLCVTLWNTARGGGGGAAGERVPPWKGSTLATIRHGYRIGGVLESVETVEGMEKAARKAYVRVPGGDLEETSAFRRAGPGATDM